MKSNFLLLLALCIGLSLLMACTSKSTSTTATSTNTDEVVPIADYVAGKGYEQYSVATFAGGCFWCTEASFERIEGVIDVISGYSGGTRKNPTYRQVASGITEHAEAIMIYFDPEVVSFETLLEVFWVAHDPTQLNRQGPDIGKQYRSEIFYHDKTQQEQIQASVAKATESGKFAQAIVTQASAYTEFWVAEAYHQDYYEHHPENRYIAQVSRPKVEKVEKTFAEILKQAYR